MGNKVQGEGDYESARHYNDETRKFVEDKKKKGESLKGDAKEATDRLSEAEESALKHAKSGGQDKRERQADLEPSGWPHDEGSACPARRGADSSPPCSFSLSSASR